MGSKVMASACPYTELRISGRLNQFHVALLALLASATLGMALLASLAPITWV